MNQITIEALELARLYNHADLTHMFTTLGEAVRFKPQWESLTEAERARVHREAPATGEATFHIGDSDHD